jgi:anthranilate phosphoribosyltransferase
VTTPVPRTWPPLLKQLIARVDLSEDDTAWAMDQIMSGAASPARIAGFAVALRAKGETPAEIAGMAATMLAHARRVELDRPAVDIVGTGGDGSNSVNISTMARSACRRKTSSAASPRSASGSSWRRRSTRRCGTPARCAASSACRRRSTCSAR